MQISRLPSDAPGFADVLAIPAFIALAIAMIFVLRGKTQPKAVTLAILAFAVTGAFLDARFTLKRLNTSKEDA